MFNWAVGREYLVQTPFRRGTEVLIRLEREEKSLAGSTDAALKHPASH